MVRNKARESNNMVSVEKSAGRGFNSPLGSSLFSKLRILIHRPSRFRCTLIAQFEFFHKESSAFVWDSLTDLT